MSRKCPNCGSGGGRSHFPGCSYAPSPEERAEFIREHAVDLVEQLEAKIHRQAKEINALNCKVKNLRILICRLAEEMLEGKPGDPQPKE